MTALASSLWTNWFLCCCCVPAGGVLDEAPVNQLNSDQLTPWCGVCGAMNSSWGKGGEDDNEKKWEVLSNI